MQDGLVVGPEVGFNLNLIEGRRHAREGRPTTTSSVNSDFDDGILWSGLGFGVAF